MTEPGDLGTDVHDVEALLPWYLSGTLKEDERQQVAQHLADCQACRLELEDLTRLRGQIKAAYADQSAPSPAAFRSVLAKIEAQSQVQRASQTIPTFAGSAGGNWLDALEQWVRSLYRPRWVPGLVAVLVVGQLGLLLWVVGERSVGILEDRGSSTDGVVSRGLPLPGVRVRLAFAEHVREQSVRAVIHELKGHIVDGPSLEGIYTIEVPASDPAAVDQKLEALRAQPDLIRVAERVKS